MNIPIRFIQNMYPMYPETDGLPMADNTLQYRWIVTIQGGLDAQYGHDPNVFVAGDLFWYPVEGHPEIVKAPDVMVALGRPREDRRSYMQWLENNIAPQVVFEILSPSNRAAAMGDKFEFYQRYGVEEYYVYDPDPPDVELTGWQRQGEQLVEISQMDGWVSPRLGIRFDMSGPELQIFGADGRRFLSYLEVIAQRDQEERDKEQAQQQAAQAQQQAAQAQQQAAQAQQQSEEASRRAERLAAQLRALGIEPEA
ncbi:MAG TPA: Uma2 family endonuclease [Gemmataceae bacterium]|nr:Uma2 family endonuclease [Gemmataceae bacterium]